MQWKEMTGLEGELGRGTLGIEDEPAEATTALKDEFWASEATNAAAAGSVGLSTQAAEVSKRRVRAQGQQGLVVLALVFSDLLLASLFWGMAILVHSVVGQGPLWTEANLTYIALNTGVWLGLRALLDLYPGYGLSPVEELRRQSYATVATLAIVAVLALAFQAGE